MLFLGSPTISIFLLLLTWLSNIYLSATSTAGGCWKKRVPILLNINLDHPALKNSRFALAWNSLAIVFLIVPVFISIQQAHKFFVEGFAVNRNSGQHVSLFAWDRSIAIFGDDYGFKGIDGLTYWPIVSPLLFVLLLLVSAAYVANYLVKLMRIARCNHQCMV